MLMIAPSISPSDDLNALFLSPESFRYFKEHSALGASLQENEAELRRKIDEAKRCGEKAAQCKYVL